MLTFVGSHCFHCVYFRKRFLCAAETERSTSVFALQRRWIVMAELQVFDLWALLYHLLSNTMAEVRPNIDMESRIAEAQLTPQLLQGSLFMVAAKFYIQVSARKIKLRTKTYLSNR